jgi:integrase
LWLGALLAKPPTGGGQRRAAASPEQVREVLQAAEQRDPELYLFLRIAATTGLRPGEVVALRWCDLDLDAPTVTISGNIVHARGLARAEGERDRIDAVEVAGSAVIVGRSELDLRPDRAHRPAASSKRRLRQPAVLPN